MKNFLKITFVLFLSYSKCLAQDISINVASVPEEIRTNSTGKILVQICNNDGGGTGNLPSYKVRPLISIPTQSGVTITGISDLPPGWTICSNSGTSIRISNGTDNIIPGDCKEFHLDISSTTIEGNFGITSTVAFGGGTPATACSSGIQTVNNSVVNDNSASSVTVTAPLPIKLLSFGAKQLDETSNLLTWATSNEVNFDNFTIESSTNAKEFVVIGKVKGGSESSKYEFKDENFIPENITYYRLKMIDLDGSFNHSKIISVNNRENFWKENLYPNPSSDRKYYIKSNKVFTDIHLVMNNGLSFPVKFNEKGGIYQIIVDNNLQAGFYSLAFEEGDQKFSKKIIIN